MRVGRAEHRGSVPLLLREAMMGQPFVGGGRLFMVLFIPGEITKHLLAPLTSPSSPAAGFILLKCAGQIRGPQESPRSCLRQSLTPEWVLGGKHPVTPLQTPPRAPQQPQQCC